MEDILKKIIFGLTFMTSFSLLANDISYMIGSYELLDGTKEIVEGTTFECSKKIKVDISKGQLSIYHIETTPSSFRTLFDENNATFVKLKEGCRNESIDLENMMGVWKTCKKTNHNKITVSVSGFNPGFSSFYGKDNYSIQLKRDILTIKHEQLMKDLFTCEYHRSNDWWHIPAGFY